MKSNYNRISKKDQLCSLVSPINNFFPRHNPNKDDSY